MAQIKFKRGTRAQLNAAAGTNSLSQGEPYLITDESRIAVGTAVNDYESFVKQSEVTQSVLPFKNADGSSDDIYVGASGALGSASLLNITVSATEPSNPSTGDIWIDIS